MSRDKNSCNVHLNCSETIFVKDVFSQLVKNQKSLLEIEDFKRVYNRTKNACRNQEEYPAKMRELMKGLPNG